MVLKELALAENKRAFIRENKAEVLQAKRKLAIKHADGIPTIFKGNPLSTKADSSDGGSLIVEVVANLTNLMDSHYDVLLPNAFNKTLADNGNNFPFLKDHQHTTEGIIGNTKDVFTKAISVASLGVESDVKMAEALIFRAEIMPQYDRKAYELYRNGGINQHSIGLKYVQISLAVNDPEDEEGYKLWNENIDKIINRKDAEEAGFFFPVHEIKLFENSAVLFGSNRLTPTLSVDSQKSEPSKDTKTSNSQQSFYHLIAKSNGNI